MMLQLDTLLLTFVDLALGYLEVMAAAGLLPENDVRSIIVIEVRADT